MIFLLRGSLRLLAGDQVTSVATRSVGGANPGAEDQSRAFRHYVGVVKIGNRIRRIDLDESLYIVR